MGLYEDMLSRGQHLYQEDRYALYQYLIKTQRNRFVTQALRLMKEGKLNTTVANGEIFYFYSHKCMSYSARRKGQLYLQEDVRKIKVSPIAPFQLKKLVKFFAQAEVDVIWNYPIPGLYKQETGSFCINSYPYADLRFFSNGKGRILGLIKKSRIDNSEVLNKLRAT